jgi:hypothetical protein
MPFLNEEVHIKNTDLTGTVVRERIDGEDIYLVRIEHYFQASALESMAQQDANQNGPLSPDTVEWFDEQTRLAGLLQLWGVDLHGVERRAQIFTSIGKLGLIEQIQYQRG